MRARTTRPSSLHSSFIQTLQRPRLLFSFPEHSSKGRMRQTAWGQSSSACPEAGEGERGGGKDQAGLWVFLGPAGVLARPRSMGKFGHAKRGRRFLRLDLVTKPQR